MTLLILSSLRHNSMSVSHHLNTNFYHPLLPFPPPCSHLFSYAGTLLCLMLPTRLVLAVQVTEGVGFRTEHLCGEAVTDVMLSLLFVLFLSGTSEDLLFNFFFSVLQFALIVPVNTDSIICSCMKLSCHLPIELAIYWTSSNYQIDKDIYDAYNNNMSLSIPQTRDNASVNAV